MNAKKDINDVLEGMKWEKVSYELLIEVIIKYPLFSEDTKRRIVDVVSKNNGNAVMKKYFVNSFINAAKKVDYIGIFSKLKSEGRDDGSRRSKNNKENEKEKEKEGNNNLAGVDEEMFNFDYNQTITNAKIEIVNENQNQSN